MFAMFDLIAKVTPKDPVSSFTTTLTGKSTSKISQVCNGPLVTLKHLKLNTPVHVCKNLPESLIISKLDYCNIAFNLPQSQKSRKCKTL